MHHTTTSTIELERLFGRAMVDAAFRAELMQNPVGIAEREGVSLTSEDIEMLGKIDQFANNHIVNRDPTIEAPWM